MNIMNLIWSSPVFGWAEARSRSTLHTGRRTSGIEIDTLRSRVDKSELEIRRIYGSSAERTGALPGWLDHYNFKRRHGSLGHKAPAARLAELEQRVE
jgi:transposase InsO family protein